jgi:hypothetical protein
MKVKKPGWFKQHVARVNLEGVARDIHRKWESPDTLEVSVTPSRIHLRLIGDDGEEILVKEAVNNDPWRRWIMLICLLMLFPLAVGLERTGIFPDGVGLFTGLFVPSAIAVIAWRNLQASFESNILTQLDVNASARALTFHELMFEAIIAFWWLQNRPLFSGVIDPVVDWNLQANNLDKGVTESVRKALVNLWGIDSETAIKSKPSSGWADRSYFDQNAKAALKAADAFKEVWNRSAVWMLWLHFGSLGLSAILLFCATFLPGIASFLGQLAR